MSAAVASPPQNPQVVAMEEAPLPNSQEDALEEPQRTYTKEENLIFLTAKFDDAQKSFAEHSSHANAILKRFKDADIMFQYLEPFIRLILIQEKSAPPVSRATKFVVKIATCVSNGKEYSDIMAKRVLEYCMKYWNAKAKHVRHRVCTLVGTMLNELDEDQEIDDDLWCMLQDRLLTRLKDRVPQVRKAAAQALNRLQDPDLEEKCPVSTALIKLMDHDKHKDVRLEALQRIDLNHMTMHEIYRRVRDSSEEVRTAAYHKLCKVSCTAFTIKDRVRVMQTGLKDRDPTTKEACSQLVLDNWFKTQNGDILSFLKLCDPEQYESETELVVKHLLKMNAQITTRDPPYVSMDLDVESVLYWRILVDYCHEHDQNYLDNILPTLTDFATLLEEKKQDEFIAWQLLKMADKLDYQDEFGRAELTKELLSIMKDQEVSNELIPFVTKILRKCVPDEDDLIRQVIENVVNEIRDPLEEVEDEEVVMKKKMLVQKLDDLYQQRTEARNRKKEAIEEERFDDAKQAKMELEHCIMNIEVLEDEVAKLQRGDLATWKRVLAIIADLLEYTQKPITHPFLQPLLETTLNPAVVHQDPDIREPGLLAFGLYCLLDKNTARSYIPLFANVLQHDQLALKYLALKIVFDIFLVFDFTVYKKKPESSDTTAQQSILADPNEDLEEDTSLVQEENVVELLGIMKTYLTHPDCDLLACAVEGFVKLLFLNRLPKLHLDVLCHLILLFFNVCTEENEHIRQTLAMFFPAYVSLKKADDKYANRKMVAACLMPCLRTVAYAGPESPFANVNITSFAEFILSLLTADPLKPKEAIQSTVEPHDSLSIHENVAFDILFEIEANMENEDVLPMCKVLGILTVDATQQHNVKQYKVLLKRIMAKVQRKSAILHLRKFQDMLKHADQNPDLALEPSALHALEERREKGVNKAASEFQQYRQSRGDEEDLPRPPSRQRVRKRKKLQGRRRPMDTSEDLKDANKKPRKRKRVHSPGRGEHSESQSEPPKETQEPTQPAETQELSPVDENAPLDEKEENEAGAEEMEPSPQVQATPKPQPKASQPASKKRAGSKKASAARKPPSKKNSVKRKPSPAKKRKPSPAKKQSKGKRKQSKGKKKVSPKKKRKATSRKPKAPKKEKVDLSSSSEDEIDKFMASGAAPNVADPSIAELLSSSDEE